MTIKAIETKYKGYRFRSRLEARWAVFFDALGIKFDYEHEGFDLDGEYYLPDFFIHKFNRPAYLQGIPQVPGFWIEIKPSPLTREEVDKLTKLAIHTGHVSVAIVGSPYPEMFAIYEHRGIGRKLYHFIPGLCDWCKNTGELLYHDAAYFKWMGEEFVFPIERVTQCGCDGNASQIMHHLAMYLGGCVDGELGDVRLLNAFDAARSARFEHGECG